MQDYNAEIYAGGQSGLTDPFAYEKPRWTLLPMAMTMMCWLCCGSRA